MSSHFGDFMDGVPVKISEKYKRPPRVVLPHSVTEVPIRAQNVVDNAKYCSTFEKNVLSKLKELRSAKETKKNERRHRVQLLEEAKQKKLDLLAAAEEEDRLKQLSVSEVSYPSTEEISALSPDDRPDRTCDIAISADNIAHTADTGYATCNNPTDSQMNILQPIQVKSNYPETSLLDDPISDPLQNLKLNSKVTRIPYSHNVETMTLGDFEQDTSSPFDNVELKTINDMELLAQVLQSQRNSSSSCDPQHMYVPDQSYVAPGSQGPGPGSEGVTYIPNQYMEHAPAASVMYNSPEHCPSNGYYNQGEMENIYMPNYQYYIPNNAYTVDPYYNNQLSTTAEVTLQNGATYIPNPYYYEYPQVPVQYQHPTYNLPVESQENNSAASQNTIVKSRSRSVPDIVRELNEEIAFAKQRANERSYNPSPTPNTPKSIPQPSSSKGKKEERRHRKKPEQLPNPYEKLSPQLQSMCQKIHSMGFPLDRVARICTLVGDNDKKVIEGLLILGEMMDLGFSEGRASAALAKHEFNRDKALDELVS